MRTLIPIFIILLSSCSKPNSKNEDIISNKELTTLFEKIKKYQSSTEDSLYLGLHPKGKWASRSLESQNTNIDSLKAYISSLVSIDDAILTEQENISKQIMLIKLNDEVDEVNYKLNLIPFNAEGGFYNSMSYIIPNLNFKNSDDYYRYLNWLPKYENLINENIELMKVGITEGIVAPRIIVNNTINLLKPWIVSDWKESLFYEPLKFLPDSINETDKDAISQQAQRVIESLQIQYATLNDFIINDYMPVAKELPGISNVPGGKEYYENRVRHYTTLPLTPDSVHNLGLAEVKRIRESMQQIINDLNFKGSFNDFITFLRTDDQFYAKTPQELLNYASWLSKKAEGQLPKYFNTLYTLPFTVEPVPSSIAPTYTTGRYVGGSWEAKKAGIYWVNTYNLKSRTLYTMPSLTLHEAVPGHHLQGALAAEIKDLPKFRNDYYISALGEGWGLYSEYLGEEMEMYATPYELFGRYTYEMWRACRLVVDTGMHYKGWTRDEALKFLTENTALSIHEVTTEIDRYIGWPGQALSYKIGEIKIKALRKKAEEALGDDFKIGAFHDAILQNGSVPLVVLEEQIDRFINTSLETSKKYITP